jgi:ferredoxin
MALRFRVDPIACTGHGLCADLMAECVELDEWGFPIVSRDVPRGLAAAARRAVRACPTLALTLYTTRDEVSEQQPEERETS